MHFLKFLGLFVLAHSATASVELLKHRDFDTNDYFTLHIKRGESPENVARALGLRYLGPLGELQDHYYFEGKRGEHDAENRLENARMRRRKRDLAGDATDGVLWHQKSKLRAPLEKRVIPPLEGRAPPFRGKKNYPPPDAEMVSKRREVASSLGISDPIFNDQWHLINTVQVGHDINITGVWQDGNFGKNATVAIIDDGLDMDSEDLKANYFDEGSYDFNDHHDRPKPMLRDDHHGTRCAGEIAAMKNDVCGVGVAWDAKVAGLRILSKSISDEDEALAINYAMQKNQIYSCSWGPPDNGQAMDAPSVLIRKSIQNGIENGRGGLGSVFVFAAGNGAASEDNCNFDGYTNSIYSITIGAIDRVGKHPYYSEKCSASMVVTYSSGSGDAIHTTDVGANNCYVNHGGTSAAAPLGAGILALVLAERPDLHWRDLQYLVMETAVPINEDDPDWQTTAIGKKYSHTYAYGKMDAYALVQKAKDWKSVKPQAWLKTKWQHIRHDIPQGDKGLAAQYTVTKEALEEANVERLEHVTVTMNVEHTQRGDLSVELISPAGVTSHLSATRQHDKHKGGYVDWTFMSVVHWGETGVGNWTIVVKDTKVNQHSGSFTDWRMILWGECVKPEHQKLYPMPTDYEDDNHDDDGADQEDGTIIGTVPVVVHPTTSLPSKPTDHPDRPVNVKPGVTTSAAEAATSASATPTPAKGEDDKEDDEDEDDKPTATPTPTPDAYALPSIFPTFGVSPRTQVWIYGAAGAILLFALGLGTFCCVWRRRRRAARQSRENYEFELVDEDERDDAAGAGGEERPLAKGGRRKRRAGELYAAFAEGSDDERDGPEEEYRDEVSEKEQRKAG